MIKSFKLFESDSQIEKICLELGIKNFQIVDGLVNVDGGVLLTCLNLKKLPIKFGEVRGSFNCSHNELTSLEGTPRIVRGNFNCGTNQLSSLDGSPNSVGGYFNCSNNNLRNFRGIPEGSLNINKIFECDSNPVCEIYGLFNNPECIDLINEYGVIGDGPTIINNKWIIIRTHYGVVVKDRLEEVFFSLGKPIPKRISLSNYKLI